MKHFVLEERERGGDTLQWEGGEWDTGTVTVHSRNFGNLE